mgnify:FL=1
MKSKSYLLSFAKAKGSIAAVALAAVLMAANATVASAQNKAAEDNGIENTIGGVDKLYGIDPSSANCTNGTNETDGNKIVCLYNVGAKKFLSIGGKWGTHASLNVSPYSIYMRWNSGTSTYFLQNKVEGSGTGQYVGIFKDKDGVNGVFMDRKENCVITFEKAKGYSETNKVYLVKINTLPPINQLGYLTAYPNDENKFCDYETKLAAEDTPEYKNQEWKVITKNEYYLLFHTAPAYMESVVDASFLITCPDFRIHDVGAANWKIGGVSSTTDVNSHVRFGDETMYKTYDKVSNTQDGGFTGRTEAHQQNYGKYFYCYTKGLRGFTFYQDVEVHKGGWYLLRCNGLSTANSSESITTNGTPLANLFITELDAQGHPIKEKYSTATLDGISQADAEALAQTHNGKNYDGAGIGHAFFEGEYENQVQICLDDPTISDKNPATLRIGFYIDSTDKSEVDANELTAVDNFKLLYAGPRRNPELILDEESTDLRYLTEAADEYKNTVLHLNRKLNDNMWNSLILPVDLTWGQMKRTFGDAVKVAKLAALTENSVQFVTVEPKNDDDVMVTAFEPYIVFPPYTQTKSPAYTVEHFYTSEGEDNSEWLGKDYKPSKDENNRLTKTVPEDHYDITMVTLDRKKLMQHIGTDNTWVSTKTFSATGGGHGMVCKGTMAKTYDNGNIISGRDDLNGDYFMYKGNLIQVPHGEMDNGKPYSYGLKAFRCWFELTGNTSRKVSLYIDGVADSTTGIDDIHGNTDCTSYKRGIDGVFNMNGQMVRRGCSLEGLPKGLYVVNGKKIIIR